MAKQYFRTDSTIIQEPMVYHNGFPIGHPEYDLEDSFCNRINQIRAIAGLFEAKLTDECRELDGEECWGIRNILKGAAEDLRAICYHMAENQEAHNVNS